jgi:hypothetical protein
VIISGSDHGVVYVFDQRTGETIDQLRIDHSDWVQTVKVSTGACLPDTADAITGCRN